MKFSLQLDNVVKKLGNFTALDNISLNVEEVKYLHILALTVQANQLQSVFCLVFCKQHQAMRKCLEWMLGKTQQKSISELRMCRVM